MNGSKDLNEIREGLRSLCRFRQAASKSFFEANNIKQKPLVPESSPEVQPSSNIQEDLDQLRSKLQTTVKLLSESLEEQGNLRALLEFSGNPSLFDDFLQSKREVNKEIDELKGTNGSLAKTNSFYSFVKHRSLLLEHEKLLQQMVDIRTELEKEKVLRKQLEKDFKYTNDLLMGTQAENDGLQQQIQDLKMFDPSNSRFSTSRNQQLPPKPRNPGRNHQNDDDFLPPLPPTPPDEEPNDSIYKDYQNPEEYDQESYGESLLNDLDGDGENEENGFEENLSGSQQSFIEKEPKSGSLRNIPWDQINSQLTQKTKNTSDKRPSLQRNTSGASTDEEEEFDQLALVESDEDNQSTEMSDEFVHSPARSTERRSTFITLDPESLINNNTADQQQVEVGFKDTNENEELVISPVIKKGRRATFITADPTLDQSSYLEERESPVEGKFKIPLLSPKRRQSTFLTMDPEESENDFNERENNFVTSFQSNSESKNEFDEKLNKNEDCKKSNIRDFEYHTKGKKSDIGENRDLIGICEGFEDNYKSYEDDNVDLNTDYIGFKESNKILNDENNGFEDDYEDNDFDSNNHYTSFKDENNILDDDKDYINDNLGVNKDEYMGFEETNKDLSGDHQDSVDEKQDQVLLSVDIGEGQRGDILVKIDSSPVELAYDFLEKYSLSPDYYEPLVEFISITQSSLGKKNDDYESQPGHNNIEETESLNQKHENMSSPYNEIENTKIEESYKSLPEKDSIELYELVNKLINEDKNPQIPIKKPINPHEEHPTSDQDFLEFSPRSHSLQNNYKQTLENVKNPVEDTENPLSEDYYETDNSDAAPPHISHRRNTIEPTRTPLEEPKKDIKHQNTNNQQADDDSVMKLDDLDVLFRHESAIIKPSVKPRLEASLWSCGLSDESQDDSTAMEQSVSPSELFRPEGGVLRPEIESSAPRASLKPVGGDTHVRTEKGRRSMIELPLLEPEEETNPHPDANPHLPQAQPRGSRNLPRYETESKTRYNNQRDDVAEGKTGFDSVNSAAMKLWPSPAKDFIRLPPDQRKSFLLAQEQLHQTSQGQSDDELHLPRSRPVVNTTGGVPRASSFSGSVKRRDSRVERTAGGLLLGGKSMEDLDDLLSQVSVERQEQLGRKKTPPRPPRLQAEAKNHAMAVQREEKERLTRSGGANSGRRSSSVLERVSAGPKLSPASDNSAGPKRALKKGNSWSSRLLGSMGLGRDEYEDNEVSSPHSMGSQSSERSSAGIQTGGHLDQKYHCL